jgi:hypothetical protein
MFGVMYQHLNEETASFEQVSYTLPAYGSRLIQASPSTSWYQSSIHHELLWERLICHPGTHRLREQVRRFQVPDMAN